MRPVGRLASLLSILALATLASTALGASPYDARPRCDGVKLRTGHSTSYPIKATIGPSTTVTVAAVVAGSRWSTLCGGATYSGSTWATITDIDGVPTSDGYGVSALYAAAGLLVAIGPVTTPPTTPEPTARPSPPPPTTPAPTTGPPSAPPPTVVPTASTDAGSSPSSSAGAAGAPSPTPRTSGDPVAAGSASTFGTPGDLIVLGLALASVFLAGFALGDRRRIRSIKNVSSSRLNDVLE
jgi:hypothetical protein